VYNNGGVIAAMIYFGVCNISTSSSFTAMISPAVFTTIKVPFPGMQIFFGSVNMPVPVIFFLFGSIRIAI